MPVAVNCWMAPTVTVGLSIVTAMEERVAAVAVRVVLPEMLPEAAVMVALPAATPAARPLLFTVATEVLLALQVA